MKTDKESENELNNGQAVIWDKMHKTSFIEFMDFALNGLAKFYHYNFIVLAYNQESKINKLPDVVGVCRGSEELSNLFITLSDANLVCRMERINKDTIGLIEGIIEN